MLFFSGTIDGRTPISNANEVRASFSRHHHLIVEGMAHGHPGLFPSEVGKAIAAHFRGEKVTVERMALPFRFEPTGTRRTPAINNLDLRIEKTFPLGAARRHAGVYVDFYNVTNQGVTLQGRVTEASGATLGDPLQFSTPRTVQAAFKVSF